MAQEHAGEHLMGHPAYEVTAGQVIFDGVDYRARADERSRLGLLWPSSTWSRSGRHGRELLRNAINARRKVENPGKGIAIPAAS